MAKEELEQLELDRRELDLPPAPPRVARQQVELEIGEDELLGAATGPTQQRPDTGDQLLVRERLDQVVVGARLEPGDPVAHRVARGQHQHRQLIAGSAQLLADLDPVAPRHHHVEHHRVERPRAQAGKRLVAVPGHLDLEPVRDEHTPKRIPQPRVVVDYQDRHQRIVAEARLAASLPIDPRR